MAPAIARVEAFVGAEHVAGSGLALPFSDDPVLYTDRLASQVVRMTVPR
jgi:hypothetical protein